MKRLTLILFAFLGIAFSTHAQSVDRSIKVINDPLFWKSDLKLSKKQINQINNANAGFYQSLLEPINENESGNKKRLETLLQRRSNDIWNVFSSRQRSKWIRIEQARNERGIRKFLPFV
jgi:hypothetical protein